METERIQIKDFIIYQGRNIYSHRPVMKLIVDIGKYGDIPTKDIPGFNDKLLAAFPGLKTNCCGVGYEGGFLDRLKEGTYLAHVLEHTVLEMQYMVGYDVRFGKTRTITENSVYYLVYEYENEVCGLECGKAAVFILNCFIHNEPVNTDSFLNYLKKVSIDAELGPSTSAIVNEAKKREIPVTRIGHESLVQLGYGRHSRLVESTLTDATSCISADISTNKQLTKAILSEQNIPVPYGKVVFSEILAVMVANQVGLPVVIKPFDGNQGKGVHLNLKNEEEIKEAFKEASKYSNGIIVEKFITGRDFRVLVVGNEVRAVSERLPASVLGDGMHTVRELVDIANQDENRGEQHEKPLTKIRLDHVALNVLKKNGMDEDTVPEDGKRVVLRENGNLSTGGIAIDCTDIIHPENADLAVRAANAIGIDIAGIDFVTSDITKPITETGGAIVEVNTAPGIRMHLYPSQGEPRNVAKNIVDLLFPNEEASRFPIVSVTGTNGKTTTVRMVQHVLSKTGLAVGMTSTSGTFIGDRCICKGDNSGPRSAKALLSNKQIDAAVLETARGGIVREGLGYDQADVGVITNIAEDHLGLDGINTLEDLAFVKSLVVEAVKKHGFAVLNAEDPMTPTVLKRVKAKKILFGKSLQSVEKYLDTGCIGVFVQNGWIRIQNSTEQISVEPVDEIPITGGGRIECNIENCLAATAALYGLNVPTGSIAEGLRSFYDNKGRFQRYSWNGIQVMLDYGHNPAGYKQVFKACKNMECSRLVGVIGMPGDRLDSSIKEAGTLCTDAFDQIYIKEDKDLRGRKPGEVANLFSDAILSAGFSKNNVQIILDEKEALKAAVKNSKQGDLIVVFYEKLEPLVDYLEAAGAQCLSSLENSQENYVKTKVINL
ncbi:MAG TPA: cyanophycin synthetase [Caproiciproducens sp.]|nr:cyanophycin synthetase [Caproiciproducens sp.]